MNPKANIALVMGGFHLHSASRPQIDEIVRAFREIGVQRIAPSGGLACSRFREAYRSGYVEGGAGLMVKFDTP